MDCTRCNALNLIEIKAICMPCADKLTTSVMFWRSAAEINEAILGSMRSHPSMHQTAQTVLNKIQALCEIERNAIEGRTNTYNLTNQILHIIKETHNEG